MAKSLPRPGSQPLCPHSSSAAHPEAPAGSGMCPRTLCLLFPQPGTLFLASTASLPSFLQVLMCPPVISGVPWGVCLLFLPSFLPSSPFLHTLSLTFFLLFPSLVIPLTTIKTYYVFYPFMSFLSLFFHLAYKLHEGREFCLSSPLNPQYLELCLDEKLSRWMDERRNTK